MIIMLLTNDSLSEILTCTYRQKFEQLVYISRPGKDDFSEGFLKLLFLTLMRKYVLNKHNNLFVRIPILFFYEI